MAEDMYDADKQGGRSMDIRHEQDQDIEIFHLEGRFDAHSAPEVEKELRAVLQDNATRLLIDMEGTEYISSAGLRVLLAMAKKLKASGGTVRLCCLQQQVQEVFDIAGFTEIFEIKSSLQEAMRSF